MHDDGEDEVIEQVAWELRHDAVRVSPELDARVMRAIRGAVPERGRGSRIWHWLRAPQPLSLSPLGGLALAATVAAVAVLGVRAYQPGGPARPAGESAVAMDPAGTPAGVAQVAARTAAPAAADDSRGTRVLAPTEDGRRWVRFSVVAPAAANTVSVVGDFNDWSATATPLRYAPAEGTWVGMIALPAGRYEYAFLVNGGSWMADPATPASTDDFGAPNSVVTITEGS